MNLQSSVKIIQLLKLPQVTITDVSWGLIQNKDRTKGQKFGLQVQSKLITDTFVSKIVRLQMLQMQCKVVLYIADKYNPKCTFDELHVSLLMVSFT